MKKCFLGLSVHFPFYLAAPSEPPGNLRWEQQGSQVSLDWEPVRPLANESEVMGYKVSICSFFEHKYISKTVTACVAHESSDNHFYFLDGLFFFTDVAFEAWIDVCIADWASFRLTATFYSLAHPSFSYGSSLSP